MINSLKLGNSIFPNNIIQGPLAGISCAPFRRLTWQYSRPAFTCSEMISCKTIIHQPQSTLRRFLAKANDEGPVCFQLAANDPLELGEATKMVTEQGADLIDLNCGCPVNKIRKKGMGSKLLQEPSKLYRLIRAMKDNTSVPISIKIRVDPQTQQFNQDVARAIADGGADFVVVHGRHWTEHYETPCRYEAIKFFVNELSIPVIGNGDIRCQQSLQKMLDTGCAGVMISRAGVGQPWLIQQLLTEMNNTDFTPPAIQQIGEILLEHILHLMNLLQNEYFAIIQARKFAKYYARRLENKIDFCAAINDCTSFKALETLVKHYFMNR